LTPMMLLGIGFIIAGVTVMALAGALSGRRLPSRS